MKKLACILGVTFLAGCQSEQPEARWYKATKNDTVALLSIAIRQNRFYGQYEMQCGADHYAGQVRGEKSGDTLTGRFKYETENGSFKLVPFVVLKRHDTFIEGTGSVWTYLNIPYYDKKSIEFKPQNLLFEPIGQPSAKATLP